MNVTLFLEIKNEYTEHLVDTMVPFIYEGLVSFYKEAVNISEDTKNRDKVLLIFQKLLQTIDGWTQHKIEEETTRIKQMSGTSDYLDDLVKSVIKSNIILLTYSNNVSNVVAQTFYNTLSTSNLVHRCYIECAKDAHNNPFLFYHDVEPMDLKRNQILIEKNIQSAIIRGIRKILPIGLILKEYLTNSVNIIYEPPHVELVGENQQMIPPVPVPLPDKVPTEKKILTEKIPTEKKSEKQPDKQLDKQVMKLINTENEKSDRDKVKALMQLEHVLNNAEANTKRDPMSPTPINMNGGRLHRILDEGKNKSEYTPNKRLNKSDKAVININFDSESDLDKTNTKSSSKTVTTLSEKPFTKNISRNHHRELSDAIDPNNVAFIEEYGAPTESTAQHEHRRRKR